MCVLGTSFWWLSGRAVTQWCLSVSVSVCLCVLGNHLDADPVQWPDSSLCVSVCLSVSLLVCARYTILVVVL